MLYDVLHQAVLVHLQLSISFGPCSSGSALLSRKLKAPRSLLSLPWYKGSCTSPREVREWSRTETDRGDSREFVMWDTDAAGCCSGAEMQNWGNQSNPTSCYRAPEQGSLAFLDRSHGLAQEKRPVVLFWGHYSTSPRTTLTKLLPKRFNSLMICRDVSRYFFILVLVTLIKVVMASQSQSWWTKIFLCENKENF